MFKVLRKYFIPNEKNEYKPHILRRASVTAISSIALLVFLFGLLHVNIIEKTNLLSAVISKTLVMLANNNRIANSLGYLVSNPLLERAAQMKADDMASKSYFAHVSPEGVNPWHWFTSAGYNFVYAGENLAINFSDSVDVDRAWMSSPAHKANILNDKFTEIGIATAKGYYNGRETVFVVQMFGRPRASNLPAFAERTIVPLTVSAETNNTPTVPATPLSPVNSPVLGSTLPPEIFVAVESAEEEIAEEVVVSDASPVKTATLAEELMASPKKTVSALYLALGIFVLASLLLMIFIEIRRQHPKLILLGISLLLLISSLFYIYRTYIFTEVIVL